MTETTTTAVRTNILDGLTKKKVAEMTSEEQTKVKNALLNKAGTVLREKHATEFEAIAEELFAGLGLERNRRLSPAERKQAELEKLAAELGYSLAPANVESASA